MGTDTVRDVLIEAIAVVSNPRKRFDDAKLRSLADSIEKDGLVQPILVRPTENGKPAYELVSGERRLRAHVLLGRGMIQSTIREMDERQAARIRLVENLHREDLHELEEAEAFAALLEEEGYTVDMLAAECGRSESYVYQRLKLLDLIEDARGAFVAGEIPASHALAIARLGPEHQVKALEYVTVDRWHGRPSTAQVNAWIAREVLLELKNAHFNPKDSELLPAAGACTTCPKRTGNIPGLWPEHEDGDRCTDRSCFERKRDAAVAAAVASGVVPICGWDAKASKAYPDALKGSQFTHLYAGSKCKHSERAVTVTGREIGERRWICRSADCPTHGKTGNKVSPAEKKRRAWDRERSRRADAAMQLVREKILERVDLGMNDVDQLRTLVELAEQRLYHEQRVRLCRELGFEGKPREYGSGRDYEPEIEAWIVGQGRDELLRTLVRLLTYNANAYGLDWSTIGESHIAKISAAFGYPIHHAVRSVKKDAKVDLPEDRKGKKKDG